MKLAPLDSIQNAHEDSLWTAAWVRSDGDKPALLLTGRLDETVRLWDPTKLTCLHTNTGHCLGVVSVTAHPNRRIAASASLDSFIRVFEVDTNNTIATLEALPSEVWQLQFSPDVSNTFPFIEKLNCFLHSNSDVVLCLVNELKRYHNHTKRRSTSFNLFWLSIIVGKLFNFYLYTYLWIYALFSILRQNIWSLFLKSKFGILLNNSLPAPRASFGLLPPFQFKKQRETFESCNLINLWS